MFLHLLAVEHTKLIRRTMLWIEVGLMAALLVLLMLMMYAMYALRLPGEGDQAAMLAQFITWPAALGQVLSLSGGNLLGGLFVIVLAGAAATQEYTWRTLHVLLSRGVPRPALLAAKFAVLLVPVVLLVAVPLLASAALTALFTAQIRGGIDVSQIDFAQLGLAAACTMFGLWPYAALTFMLGVVTRSTVAAIGGGLAYALLLETVVIQVMAQFGGALGSAWKYLPAGLVMSLQRAGQGGAEASGQAALGIAAYVVVFFGVALWAFRRQDLTA